MAVGQQISMLQLQATALDSAANSVVITDREGTVLWVNSAFAKLTGYTAAEAIGQNTRLLKSGKHNDQFYRNIWSTILRGSVWRGEVINRRKDGSFYVEEMTITPVRSATGSVSHFIAIKEDITARRKAEEAIQRQAEMLRLSFDAIFVWRIDGGIESWNRGAEQFYGYSESEALGRVSHELLKTISPVPWPEIESILRQRGTWEGELRHITKEGREVTVASRYQLITDANGVELILETNRDITESKQTAEALQESERRYRTLFESIDEGFCVLEVLFDQDGRPNDWRFLEVNQAFEKHNGLVHAAGKTIREIVPKIEARWFDIYGRVATTGEPTRLVEFSQALGRWFDLYVFRVGEPEQRRVAVLFNNITERKQAAETSARLAAIIQSSADAIIGKDLDGIVFSWNQSAEQIFGYSAEEMIGKSITLIIPPERLDEEAAFLESMRRGEQINHYETVRVHKSGKRIDVSVSISPVFDASGKLFAISKIVRDISDRKRTEQALIRSEKLASVGRMAATIAHEINNPLASAINAVYLAKTDPALPGSIKSNLALAEQELNRVSHITKQTLGFYKEVGTPAAVDLPGVLDSLLDLYEPRLKSKKISVQRSYHSSIGIRANEGEVRQIVSNIIANSIDALPECGKLHVRLCGPQTLSGHRRMVRLTIADNGEGIVKANMKRIFEPFFTTKKSIGTGLGLWVVSELVKRHEGRLRIRSKPGKGTILTIWLPMERRNWQQRRSA